MNDDNLRKLVVRFRDEEVGEITTADGVRLDFSYADSWVKRVLDIATKQMIMPTVEGSGMELP